MASVGGEAAVGGSVKSGAIAKGLENGTSNGNKNTTVIDLGSANSSSVVSKSNRDITKAFAVVKRNGMIVPFRAERILAAIEAGFRAVQGIPASTALPQEIFTTVQKIAQDAVAEAAAQALKGDCITVESIQDIVEVKLMEAGHYEVARSYIVYREEHKALREDSPRNLKILRRDGESLVRFNPMKIAAAIEKAFRASLKIDGITPDEIVRAVNLLTNKVVGRAQQLVREGKTLHVEMIQDEVERQMMGEGYYQIAKDFILYRAERARVRAEGKEEVVVPEIKRRKAQLEAEAEARAVNRNFTVTRTDGTTYTLSESEIRETIEFACRGLEGVNSEDIVQASMVNFYEGIKAVEVDQSNLMAARAKVEKEPNYSFAAARILLDIIYREAFGSVARKASLDAAHKEYFKEYVKTGINVERLDPALMNFDLDRLASAIKLERDQKFSYLGLQTLYDRYLIHHEDRRIETPQIFWMRVAMGLSLLEGDQKNERAIEFYEVLSTFRFTSSTPTLFNSGTLHPQLSSCYLSTVMDDLKHIFKIISDDAQLSKWAGGLGNDWSNVRATGARIKGTNGRSQGVIPFLKVANDTAVAVNQGGKRKGAMCAYLETWHLDIEDFLELRKNTGDERRRTHDMNTANWIPDLFMKRVSENSHWTLFSPSDVPDLHDLYGQAFEARYTQYEAMVERGEIKHFKKIEAVQLWRKMLSMLFETGHPWITFKDPSNIRSPQDHEGVVHCSNLCTEILLNTSEHETAVCNLGSINLVAHVSLQGLDKDLLASTVRTAVRMLDNVVDINFYPTIEAKNANLRHRPVGLGIMGFQDALYAQRISYASVAAVEFADRSMEVISYYAVMTSAELAKERGTYPSYKGSKWDRGIMPIDTLKMLVDDRGGYIDVDMNGTLDWAPVREAVRKYGMRNSNTMAIAPTATISNITGVSQSIEPAYKHLYAKSNLSGEFTNQNVYLIRDLKRLGLWDDEMIDDLKYFDGTITEIERIPQDIKALYLTAFEIEPEWLIECASRRQKWIDMGQSLNLYLAEANGKKLHDMYMHAWKKGLKTTYYLRSLGATQIEKSTTDINKRGLQPRWMKNKSASADVVLDRAVADGTATEASAAKPASLEKPAMPRAMCNLDGDCESCQ